MCDGLLEKDGSAMPVLVVICQMASTTTMPARPSSPLRRRSAHADRPRRRATAGGVVRSGRAAVSGCIAVDMVPRCGRGRRFVVQGGEDLVAVRGELGAAPPVRLAGARH